MGNYTKLMKIMLIRILQNKKISIQEKRFILIKTMRNCNNINKNQKLTIYNSI